MYRERGWWQAVIAWHGHGIGRETGHLFVRVVFVSCLRGVGMDRDVVRDLESTLVV